MKNLIDWVKYSYNIINLCKKKMKKQIKLTESAILEAVKEAVSDFISNKEIDKPSFYGYDYTKHIDNPSQEQKDVDNKWSEKHAFSPYRNLGQPNFWAHNDPDPNYTDDTYINDSDAGIYPDENTNIKNFSGWYGVDSQGNENDELTHWARSQRGTSRQTDKAFSDYLNAERKKSDSVLDKIVSETIQREIKKFYKKH